MNTAQRIILILLAVSLLVGITTGNRLYYRLSYLWGLLFFGGWLWSATSLRGLRIIRTARTLRAQVGQIFEERYEIQNESALPRLWLEVRNESLLPGSEGSRVLTMLEGKQGRSYLARTRLVQRGVFPLGPTMYASGDLFGLFPIAKSIPASELLLVYPMMVEIQNFPNPPGLLAGGEALRRKTHQVTPNAAGVREYMHGDALNRIHWMSTARRGHLMVKEFELDPLADVWVFLDTAQDVQAALPPPARAYDEKDFWRSNAKIQLDPSTEEYGVTISASIVRYYLARSRAVGLVSSGQHLTLLPPDRGGRQLGKILEALAILHAHGKLPLRVLIETQAKHISRGSTVVLITPSIKGELAVVVDYLLRLGLRPVVVLLNVSTFGGSEGTGTLEAYIQTMGVPVFTVDNGADLQMVLSSGGKSKL